MASSSKTGLSFGAEKPNRVKTKIGSLAVVLFNDGERAGPKKQNP